MITKNNRIKGALKENDKNLKGGSGSVYCSILGNPSSLKRLMTTLKAQVDNELFSAVVLPKADWTQHVYKIDVCGTDDACCGVTWPHLGMMEARLVLSGTGTFVGIRTAAIPGDTLRAKREHLTTLPFPDIAALIKTEGWAVHFENGVTEGENNLVCIPTGFAVLWAADQLKYLRW